MTLDPNYQPYADALAEDETKIAVEESALAREDTVASCVGTSINNGHLLFLILNMLPISKKQTRLWFARLHNQDIYPRRFTCKDSKWS
jgi:hypothetical protein